MSEQIIQLKLSDLRKLFKEVASERPKNEFVTERRLIEMEKQNGIEITKEQLRYMREVSHPAIFKKPKGRWLINYTLYKQTA